MGHEVDSMGLNMTQARIKSRVAFTKPGALKELSLFLGVVNYFRDHMWNHYQHAHSLNEMVATANKHATKTITGTTEGLQGFEKFNAIVNACPKLYFINNACKVVLYTDAPDYAHGAYLCQIAPTGEGEETREEPIRFLSGSFIGAQARWSTIEKEAYAINWAPGVGQPTRGNHVHNQNRPQEPLVHEQAWIKKVPSMEVRRLSSTTTPP